MGVSLSLYMEMKTKAIHGNVGMPLSPYIEIKVL